ncbi:MAG TPA: hypothetical protein VJ044_04050, partial [Candidatus Hodarchaeales archaeon]|nr:hypothetical protein [Candidatus Hodarchaeales archaeon]
SWGNDHGRDHDHDDDDRKGDSKKGDTRKWKLIASGLSETSYNWDISRIHPHHLKNVKIMVVADDGHGLTSSDTSDRPFTIFHWPRWYWGYYKSKDD